MKFTTVAAVALAASTVVAQHDNGDTTFKSGKFNKTKASHAPTSSGTHKWGKFDKTKASHSPTSTGTHKWGKFNKTNKKQASENEAALAKMSSSFLVAGIAAFLL